MVKYIQKIAISIYHPGLPFLIFSIYLAIIGNGNAFFPSLKIYGLVTLFFSLVCLHLFYSLNSNAPFKSSNFNAIIFYIIVFSTNSLCLFRYPIPTLIRVILIVVPLSALSVLIWRSYFKAQYWLSIILVIGLAERIWSIHTVSFGTTSDMLPLVVEAIKTFLSGETPYKEHMIHMPFATYPLKLTYMPFLWLSYIPAYLIKIDLRWTNIIADIAAAVIIFKAFPGRTSSFDLWKSAIIAVWFCNFYFASRIDSEISIFNLTTALTVWAIVSRHHLIAGVSAGLMLLTCQLAVIVLPFLLIWSVEYIGLKKLMPAILISLCISVATYLYFYNDILFHSAFNHWKMFYLNDVNWARNNIANFNYSVFAYYFRKQQYLVYVQVLIISVLFIHFLFVREYEMASKAINCAAYALLLFIQFNIIVWAYLFLPIFTLWSIALIAKLSEAYQMQNLPAGFQRNDPIVCTSTTPFYLL